MRRCGACCLPRLRLLLRERNCRSRTAKRQLRLLDAAGHLGAHARYRRKLVAHAGDQHRDIAGSLHNKTEPRQRAVSEHKTVVAVSHVQKLGR